MISIDLASKRDLTAKMTVFRQGGDYFVFGQYYLPSDAIEAGMENYDFYRGWAREGWLSSRGMQGEQARDARPLDDAVENKVFCLHYRSADDDSFDIQKIYYARYRRTDVHSSAFEHHLGKIVIVLGSRNNTAEIEVFFIQFPDNMCGQSCGRWYG